MIRALTVIRVLTVIVCFCLQRLERGGVLHNLHARVSDSRPIDHLAFHRLLDLGRLRKVDLVDWGCDFKWVVDCVWGAVVTCLSRPGAPLPLAAASRVGDEPSHQPRVKSPAGTWMGHLANEAIA